MSNTAPAPEIPAALADMGEIVDGEIVDDTPAPVPAVAEPGTDLEPHTGGRQLVADDEWSDVDDMDLSPSDRFVIPLYQLNRKADGGFLNEDTGETVREIEAVLMAKVNTRAWWPQQFGKGDAAPSCRSSNGVEADVERSPALQPDFEMPTRDLRGLPQIPTGVCATCPNSQWDGDEPPSCGESIEFLAFVPTEHAAGKVVRLRFSGMGFGPARAYWESFKTRLPKRPAVAFVTQITLEEKDTDNGVFLVPVFRRVDSIPRANATAILEARAQRKTEWQQAVATDERPAVDDVATSTGSADGSVDLGPDEEPF
jgi:hypothetical protein